MRHVFWAAILRTSHIDNIHKGKANVIPFIEYIVGRREGLYPLNARPSFGSKKRTIVEKTQDECVNMYIHRAVETFLPPVGDVAYHSLMKRALNDKVVSIWMKRSNHFSKY
jgi:hypothetical protein